MSSTVSARWPFVAGSGAPVVVKGVGTTDLREVIVAIGGKVIRLRRGGGHLNVLADKLEDTPRLADLLQAATQAGLAEARPHTRIPGQIRGAM